MLFEQDGYKTFGEKNVGGFLLQICDLTSLGDGEHFYGGCMNILRSFGDIHKNALFKKFCGIFKEGWYKKYEEIKKKKKNPKEVKKKH